MKDFNELRRLAREKRDTAIKEARDEYRITLADINALQQRLLQKPSQKGKPKPLVPMRKKILDVVPTDREWTVDELLSWLELPTSDKNQLRATLTKMIKAGTIKRVRRGKRHMEALFAVTGFTSSGCELNALTQVQAARKVMAEIGENANVAAVAVAMRERGYQPAAKNHGDFVKSLRAALRRNYQQNIRLSKK